MTEKDCDRCVVCQKHIACNLQLEALDMKSLRFSFARLTDEAAAKMFGQGLDFDDVIVERYLVVKGAGVDECRVSADWLSNGDRLIDSVQAALRELATSPIAIESVEIVGLLVEFVQQAGPV